MFWNRPKHFCLGSLQYLIFKLKAAYGLREALIVRQQSVILDSFYLYLG